jgi:hypothetical protein
MSQFKNNQDINLYYTDTDSIYTDSILNDSFVDAKVLGKLKLENICEKAIFLAPKMYFLKTVGGDIVTKTNFFVSFFFFDILCFFIYNL